LIFVYFNLFTSRSILAWRATERFFAEYFGFLFNNTSWYYLVFASLLPIFKLYIYCLLYLLMT